MTIEDLKLARIKLNANNVEDGLPGREEKIKDVYDFLYNRMQKRKTTQEKRAKIRASEYANVISKHDNKTLMICGIPGTGKTVTVMEVLKILDKLQSQKNCPIEPFRHIYINAQTLKDPVRVYSEIYYKLIGKMLEPQIAQEKLEEMFSNSAEEIDQEEEAKRKRRSCRVDFNGYTVIVVDELDLLYNEKRQSILYSLFDWPSRAEIKTIVVGIANAMDLSERFIRSGKSRCGWERCVFEPYTSVHLQAILETRLGMTLLNKTFDKNAIIIATKRIGRTTGDARRILDTCKLALDQAINLTESTGTFTKVTATIVDKTGFHNYDEQRANYVMTCRPLELFILKCILLQMNNVGDENLRAGGLFKLLIFQMSKYQFSKNNLPSLYEFSEAMSNLAAVGMITLDNHLVNIFAKKYYLNEDTDALKDLIRNEDFKIMV